MALLIEILDMSSSWTVSEKVQHLLTQCSQKAPEYFLNWRLESFEIFEPSSFDLLIAANVSIWKANLIQIKGVRTAKRKFDSLARCFRGPGDVISFSTFLFINLVDKSTQFCHQRYTFKVSAMEPATPSLNVVYTFSCRPPNSFLCMVQCF